MTAKAKKKPHHKAPSLPVAPWDVSPANVTAQPPRPARRGVERAAIPLDATGERDSDGHLVASRARVWRVAATPTMRNLSAPCRAAMLDFADLFETVGASGGTCDPSSSGGGAPGSRPPSLRKIEAAQSLRWIMEALKGRTLVLGRRSGKGGPVGSILQYGDLARMVAVEGQSRAAILRHMHAGGEAAEGAFLLALVECATLIAVCTGHVTRER